ncbi:hypothetical protein ACFQS3_03600 [Glycomyces mayteni]|uniref:Uncharacterized protein n=1 Tax=Glycomyces mayteni TaxID=543887 RepID=A0ABW2D2F9_9ACTN|nr:hypothetical protein GCM10025732_50550 [Glycomyces mayteni]
MKETLTQRDRVLLLALLVHDPSFDIANTQLRSAFGIGVEKANRERLSRAGYLNSIQAKGSTAKLYTLTPKGRERAMSELSNDADPKSTVNLRVVYAVFNSMHRFLRRNHLDADAVFEAQDGSFDDAIDAELSNSIQDEYRRLAEGRSMWVPLRTLRAALPDISRESLDETLTALCSHRIVHLTSESNRKSLRDADHEAALNIGGDAKHFIAIEAG